MGAKKKRKAKENKKSFEYIKIGKSLEYMKIGKSLENFYFLLIIMLICQSNVLFNCKVHFNKYGCKEEAQSKRNTKET